MLEDDAEVLETLASTFEDAEWTFDRVTTFDEFLNAAQREDISLAIVRAAIAPDRCVEVCRQIRKTRSADELCLLVVLQESEMRFGPDALIAGATDLLIAPFEPRELRTRAGIVPPDQSRRIDVAHGSEQSADVERSWFVPEFDSKTFRISFGEDESQVSAWEFDPGTRKIALDQVIVCPECESIPTFRHGCGACGSAWTEEQVLLHHYACAHVGPEADFRQGDSLVCPKCRLTDLVAGSDFERTVGCRRCNDCDAMFSETQLIGHCLSCHNRFPASEGKVISIYGYETGHVPAAASIPSPNYQISAVDSLRGTRR